MNKFDYLLNRLDNRKITLEKIGELTGISHRTIGNIYYRVTPNPGYSTVIKLLDFFNKNPNA
jgi:transcriptional regulator with XRE-family HTH domain